MKRMIQHKTTERGQSLAIMTVAIVAFLAMLALVLDGGMAFANRRFAQKAADAGALAGARTLCLTDDPVLAHQVANEYATTRNGAQSAIVTIDIDAKTVAVVANMPFQTFFAHILGFSQITADAEAEAGCVSPGLGDGVLPIAWSCRPPLAGLSDSGSCQEQWITYEELEDRINDNPPDGAPIWPELYILMDSADLGFDVYCLPDGVFNCDLDGDGDDDISAGGDRSWLDLDGQCGASCLMSWIEDGFDSSLSVHTWLPGQTGVANAVFQSVDLRQGDVVAVPVYDQFCDGRPETSTACISMNGGSTGMDSNDLVLPPGGSGGLTYFHVIAFAAFYISCVDSPGVPGSCPGHTAAVDQGVIDHNAKTVEGYFVNGFIPGISGGGSGGVDTGAYVLRLTR